MLENLRLAVRSQLGFTSIRLPTSGRHGNLWRRLFNFTRSRRSGSLALVSSDPEDSAGNTGGGGAGPAERTGAHRGLLPLDSDDTDTEGERRDASIGAVGGGLAAPLPQKTPPASAVEAIVAVTASLVAPAAPGRDQRERERERERPLVVVDEPLGPESPRGGGPPRAAAVASSGARGLQSARGLVTRSLHWVRGLSLGRAQNHHSPLRQLEHGGGGGEGAGGSRGEEEDDVELLIPTSDPASDSDSASSVSEACQPLLERRLLPQAGGGRA